MQRLILASLLCVPSAAFAQTPTLAEYQSWLAGHAPEVAEFEAFLMHQGVAQVLPTEQLLRTATSWRSCKPPKTPFQVPPKEYWSRAVPVLRIVRDQVVPRIGAVEAVSSYRSPLINKCAKGAKQSPHLGYWGFDLIPLTAIKKSDVEKSLCSFHRTHGKPLALGLGFYSGERFHIDSKGYRRWGVNGRSNTSPCLKD